MANPLLSDFRVTLFRVVAPRAWMIASAGAAGTLIRDPMIAGVLVLTSALLVERARWVRHAHVE